MIVIGLTGSIGMGKSTTAQMFRELCISVHDSDKAVHNFYNNEGASSVEALFPGVLVRGKVDRQKLSSIVLADNGKMGQLEALVHPWVGLDRLRFILRCESAGESVAVLDIPLLFETGGEKAVDIVVVVSATGDVQRARVLGRPGMTQADFETILQKQVPDFEKRRRAHFVIETSFGFEAARGQVSALCNSLASIVRIDDRKNA